MSPAVIAVDAFAEERFLNGNRPFRRGDLARFMHARLNDGHDWLGEPHWASLALQDHRRQHAHPDPAQRPKYVLERTGMGPGASWRIALAADWQAILTRTVDENSRRIVQDLLCRVSPAASHDAAMLVLAARAERDVQRILTWLAEEVQEVSAAAAP